MSCLYIVIRNKLLIKSERHSLNGIKIMVTILSNVTEITATNIKSAKAEVTYFPRTDSLLFTNMNAALDRYAFYYNLGYGGFTYMMRFHDDGTVSMLSDDTTSTAATARTSEYSVHQNSSTMLSFTTYNYLHSTVNAGFRGTADWLYLGQNSDSMLVFRSGRYIEPAREMIVMRRIKPTETTDSVAMTAYRNRKLFEDMVNPQIKIHRGDRTFFQSDYFIKARVSTNEEYVQTTFANRYYVFIFVSKPNPIPDDFPTEIKGAGTGYVGTAEGMKFYPGFRYSSTYIFEDFQRVDDHFEAELVRIYDPIDRRFRYVSKHLYPDGEFTGMKAEIFDSPR